MTDQFTVRAGDVANTVVYEDARGSVCFSFKISSSKDVTQSAWNLWLDNGALGLDGRQLGEAGTLWLSMANERTASYLNSLGFVVKPGPKPPAG